jgi:dienelactone hydrolase
MKAKILFTVLILVIGAVAFISLTNFSTVTSKIKEDNITYTCDNITFKGFVAYAENVKGKMPVVLVVHEWWGLNDYTKMRARQLAELGYISIAVDLFGEGKNAANPKEAMDLAMPFYKDPQMAKNRLDAALAKIKEYPQADAGNVVAIGYCFGGAMVLNAAKLGADFKGVVSFHGGLAGVPANKALLKAKILVCHGGADKFVSQKDVDGFKHQMDSIGADYTFKIYANATHAFTNPNATKVGKEFNMPIEYNEEADKNSWNDMKLFFSTLFK